VTIAIFVYISEANVSLGALMSGRIRSPAIFIYVLRHLIKMLKLRIFTPRDSLGPRLSAIFVNILHHLFTYKRINLGLFTPR